MWGVRKTPQPNGFTGLATSFIDSAEAHLNKRAKPTVGDRALASVGKYIPGMKEAALVADLKVKGFGAAKTGLNLARTAVNNNASNNGANNFKFDSFSQYNPQLANQLEQQKRNNNSALNPKVKLTQGFQLPMGAVKTQNPPQLNPSLASNSPQSTNGQQSANGQQSDNQNSVIQMLLNTLQSPKIRQQLTELFEKVTELNKSSESPKSKQDIINNLIDIVVKVTEHKPSDTINIGNYTYKLQQQTQ